MRAKLELAHRLQTSKMRRNLTSLNTCQNDVNIVTICVTRQRCTALFCALGPLFCALVREEAIFAACKRCANEGFACMCKENVIYLTMLCLNL